MTEPANTTDAPEAAEPGTIEFYGETFAVSDRLGFLALSRFYRAGKRNVDSKSVEGMLALADIVEQLIAADDWQRFSDLADAKRAEGDDMWKVVSDASEVIVGRPTSRSSDSSDGPSDTEAPSTPDSVSPDEFPGRPDLGVVQLRVARSAA